MTVEVRTDNISAPTMVTKMQPRGSPRMGLVAREMALDISASTYSPDVASHIPGVANRAADALSRASGPSPPPLPSYLNQTMRSVPEARGHGGRVGACGGRKESEG